jgi:hypothetical protein
MPPRDNPKPSPSPSPRAIKSAPTTATPQKGHRLKWSRQRFLRGEDTGTASGIRTSMPHYFKRICGVARGWEGVRGAFVMSSSRETTEVAAQSKKSNALTMQTQPLYVHCQCRGKLLHTDFCCASDRMPYTTTNFAEPPTPAKFVHFHRGLESCVCASQARATLYIFSALLMASMFSAAAPRCVCPHHRLSRSVQRGAARPHYARVGLLVGGGAGRDMRSERRQVDEAPPEGCSRSPSFIFQQRAGLLCSFLSEVSRGSSRRLCDSACRWRCCASCSGPQPAMPLQ